VLDHLIKQALASISYESLNDLKNECAQVTSNSCVDGGTALVAFEQAIHAAESDPNSPRTVTALKQSYEHLPFVNINVRSQQMVARGR
jgi:hypothetical protein